MTESNTQSPSEHLHDRGTDRLLAAVAEARELTPLERKQLDAETQLRSVQASFPNERIVACSGCLRPTLGSFGPSGMLWRTVCQTCKDEADNALERSCAALGKVGQWTTDTIMDRVRRDLAAADSATKHETGKPTTTNTRDDGEAVTGTLPRGPVTHTGMPKGDFEGISNPDRRGQ